MIGALGPLLPKRYSPIHPVSGYGNQKAYLAEIPQDVFEVITAAAAFGRQALVRGGANSLTFQVVSEMLDDVVERSIAADLTLEDTVRASLVQARRGQGRFRANVQALEQRCRLTGVTNPSLLVASHIKPWRLCASAHERLDGMNGFLLTPDADLLFDRGFITFQDDGEVIVSRRVDPTDLQRLGFEQLTWTRFGVAEAPSVWQAGSFAPERHSYLAYHRSEVFVS
jgi:putative restriction endonuclease